MLNEFNWKSKALHLPDNPGVYIMKDDQDEVVYIGKAGSLKKRVSSYFQSREGILPHVKRMIEAVENLEIVLTNSEAEALILENNLIKKYEPRYNVRLKDAKTYPYVKITMNETYPRFIITRKLEDDGSVYYGPYTDVKAIRNTLHYIRRFFPVATCVGKVEAKRKRPCLEYQINRCVAPCVDLISKEEYDKLVEGVRHILEGRNQKLVQDLHKRIQTAASQKSFERAAVYRDQLRMVEKIVEKQSMVSLAGGDQDVIAIAGIENRICVQVFLIREGKVLDRKQFILEGGVGSTDSEIISAFVKQYYADAQYVPDEIVLQTLPDEVELIQTWLSEKGHTRLKEAENEREKDLLKIVHRNAVLYLQQKTTNPQLKKEVMQIAIKELQQAISIKNLPHRIEGFDISNIQGTNAVGSLVVFVDGEPVKSEYRKFKIKTVKGSDDYAMIGEIVERRYTKIMKEGLQLPDLVLIDGGKGHFNITQGILSKLGLQNLPVIAIAKEHEEIFTPNRENSIELSHDSQALFLVQRVRDEAHRFAIKYHKNLRKTTMSESILDQIQGIGTLTKINLLNHFGSIERLKKATLSEIRKVKRINPALAERIYNFFKDQE